MKKQKNEDKDLNNEMDNGLDNGENQPENNGKGRGYASFCLAVIAVIFLPLIYVIGIYGLCASALCALASLSFYNSQKTRGLFALVKAAKILAYVALILCAIVLIGAIIYSAI